MPLTKELFNKILKERILILDGAMGTLLQERGLKSGQSPEELNLTKEGQEIIKSVHLDYLQAGSDIILTNTFGATARKLSDYGLENKIKEINYNAVKIARKCAKKFNAFVGGSIGAIGTYLKPIGPLSFEDAYNIFSQQIRILSKAGVDLIFIETISDISELKSALLAAKDNFKGPIISMVTFTEDKITVSGTSPLCFLSVAESMGTDGVGINCSVGPKDLYAVVKEIIKFAKKIIVVKPNRGLPVLVNRETVFPGTLSEFLSYGVKFANLGVNLIGGCCGTNPEFIRELTKRLKNKKPKQRKKISATLISSRTNCVIVKDKSPLVVVGERINPTGKKDFQEELRKGVFKRIRKEATLQVKEGAKILDINVGIAGGDEVYLLKNAVSIVQSAVNVPIMIDSTNREAIETALKLCEGKPILNSTTAEDKKLNELLPLIKRYGGCLVGLTLSEKGIPENAKGRIKLAEKIIKKATELGICDDDIIIDNLTLSLSAQQNQAIETLKAIKICREKLKVKTILGVSNVSFGLPQRHIINSAFLNVAREYGLNFAILNPRWKFNIRSKDALNVINRKDKGCKIYIKKYGKVKQKEVKRKKEKLSPEGKLYNCILEGDKDYVLDCLNKVLEKGYKPMDINNKILLKAMEEVGEKFEKKEFFLPDVILSSETMQFAFDKLKGMISKKETKKIAKIILATVYGDIHDIGKNIVKIVMENYGFEVIDLGKNVETKKIINVAKKENVELIGLSALMTTTMPVMEDVINLKNKEKIKAKILVGGAAVTKKFANSIGADAYCSNAMDGVKKGKELIFG
jgi:5-methyltetrahydrofolate--homocysteine methyltransferase